MQTDYSRLLVGQCPITDFDLDFAFGSEKEAAEGVEGDLEKDAEDFKPDTKTLVKALPPMMQRIFTMFFDLTSEQNFINIFKKLAVNFIKMAKSGVALVVQVVNLVRKCCPPHFPAGP